MRKYRMALLVSILALVAAIPCSATPVPVGEAFTLAQMIEGDLSITIGDKVFSDFLPGPGGGIAGGGSFSPQLMSQIIVQGYQDGPFLMGLKFTGAFSAVTFHDLGIDFSFADIQFEYTVTASSATISDVHLGYNGGRTGLAQTSITELVYNDAWDQPYILSVSNPPPVFLDAVIFDDPVQTVRVRKDIQLTAQWTESTGDANANISSIDQFYSQVPEPSSLIFLGSGLIAMGIWVRRKR
jgi:hypothetical protein